MIKKKVLMAKLRAVRSGGGESITASYNPEINMITEVDEVESKDKKADKVIDIMKGKNKIEVNPQIKAENYHGVKEEAGCETKKIENKGKKKIDPNKNPVVEAKVDQGRSDYGKATIRNWRHSGPSTVEPAMFDPENKRGKTIDKRREEHKARRGVKKAKVPAYKVNEEDKAFNFVLNKLKSKYGSGVMTKGDKMPEPSAAQKKKNAAIRAKRAKEDHRDPTEKASDGRYSDRHSNRGSD